MTKRKVGDVIYLESEDSSGIETEYENITYEENGVLLFKRRKLYKVRYKRTLPKWLQNDEEKQEKKKENEFENEKTAKTPSSPKEKSCI